MPTKLVVILLSLTLGVIVSAIPAVKDTSEQNSINCLKCHEIDREKINVHLVPHSHDDVGWLKTVDQYYYGLNSSIVIYGVHYIITTMVEALEQNSDRRYVQVETAFFWLWWKTQNENFRQKFRKLVDNGQIEIVNGAWSMNDEACVNYQSTIDQFTWGLRTIQETLGECGKPSVGWQLDPFGHSREQVSLITKIGFDGLFFTRLALEDREKRMDTKTMDFAWQGSANLDDSEIFTGIFGTSKTSNYGPPKGFCWDVVCTDDVIVEDEDSPEYNVKEKIELFKNISKTFAGYFPTNNILMPMGSDFHFMSAEKNFDNIDRLIKIFANDTELNVFYSTPSCYIQAVHSSSPNLTLKTDDFFPYSSTNHSYWAGYFTSRQNFKRFERIGNNVLQVAKQLSSIARIKDSSKDYDKNLTKLREAMGIAQHHDAITGTEKDHVNKDYIRQLALGIKIAEEPFGEILSDLISKSPNETVSLRLSSCHLANMSICDASQDSESFLVILYNPLSWTTDYMVRLPVEGASFNVTGPNGQLDNDVFDPISTFSYVNLSQTPSAKELVFPANNIPPMGVQVYYVTKTANISSVEADPNGEWVFGNENVNFEINNTTNLLQSVTMNNKTLNISQTFLYYKSVNGTLGLWADASGAYLFRPQDVATPFDKVSIISKVKGKVVDEVKQQFGDYITQIIRVYKGGQDYIEFDWIVGPIDVSDGIGTEIITRFTVDDFNNNSTFYTDSNGREMMKRVLNQRPDYTYDSSYEPIASNYYPVTSKIVIKDNTKDLEVAVLNDRSQGGSSLENGQVELMVHRRLAYPDNKSVNETLNELEFGTGVVARGQHYLIFGSSSKTDFKGKTTAAQERILAHKKLLQPWMGLTPLELNNTFDSLQKTIYFNATFLKTDFPENVKLLTLEPWVNSSYLLRLEHILEQNEDPTLSTNVTVDLSNLFANNSFIADISEVALGADRPLGTRRYQWNHTQDSSELKIFSLVEDPSNVTTAFSLTPMQIRTFIVKPYASDSWVFRPALGITLVCLCSFKLIR